MVRPHQSICRLPNAIPSGQSHVNYNDAEVYDYPSVGQIAQALREEEIIPIFAAVSSVRNFYAVSLIIRTSIIGRERERERERERDLISNAIMAEKNYQLIDANSS